MNPLSKLLSSLTNPYKLERITKAINVWFPEYGIKYKTFDKLIEGIYNLFMKEQIEFLKIHEKVYIFGKSFFIPEQLMTKKEMQLFYDMLKMDMVVVEPNGLKLVVIKPTFETDFDLTKEQRFLLFQIVIEYIKVYQINPIVERSPILEDKCLYGLYQEANKYTI